MARKEAIEILSDMRCECNLFGDEEEATRYHVLSWAINAMNAEQKHGRWINDNGLYKCSVCNEFTITGWANCIPIEQMNKTMKYCNNCGAKMDEVKE